MAYSMGIPSPNVSPNLIPNLVGTRLEIPPNHSENPRLGTWQNSNLTMYNGGQTADITVISYKQLKFARYMG